MKRIVSYEIRPAGPLNRWRLILLDGNGRSVTSRHVTDVRYTSVEAARVAALRAAPDAWEVGSPQAAALAREAMQPLAAPTVARAVSDRDLLLEFCQFIKERHYGQVTAIRRVQEGRVDAFLGAREP